MQDLHVWLISYFDQNKFVQQQEKYVLRSTNLNLASFPRIFNLLWPQCLTLIWGIGFFVLLACMVPLELCYYLSKRININPLKTWSQVVVYLKCVLQQNWIEFGRFNRVARSYMYLITISNFQFKVTISNITTFGTNYSMQRNPGHG